MTVPPPLVILLGLRGSGKTTVGRLLARRLSRPFVDLDDLVAAQAGRPSVAALWAEVGQPAFRALEAAALARALAPAPTPPPSSIPPSQPAPLPAPPAVLALGGGTPTAPGAPELLRETRASGRALLFYLRADSATLRTRLAATNLAQRPTITGAGPLEEIDRLLNDRDPLYRALAGVTVEVAGLAAAQVVDVLADEVAHAMRR